MSRPCREACQPVDHRRGHPDHPEPESGSSTSATTAVASLSPDGLPTTLNVSSSGWMPFGDPWQSVRYGFLPFPDFDLKTSTVAIRAIDGSPLLMTYVLPTGDNAPLGVTLATTSAYSSSRR